jgi:eukaryotic-like serine/threonine-protein kinase
MLQENDIITMDRGRYRLRTPLARSAYGIVWQAEAPAGMPDVALKLINRAQMAQAQPALQDRWVASANNEIDFLRQLATWDERHIVRLLDSGVHDGLPVMALELMGADLGRHADAKTATLGQVLDWMGQVNQALAKVHQHGWLYLDLKPANVLLERDGNGVKLADFGTSRLRASLAPGHYSGTASWQAPEQFFPSSANTYDTDSCTDYFALGAMLYYLVTGGLQLRFCSACGEAWRTHHSQAPAALLAENGGAIPLTLHEEEAALFAHRVERHAGTRSSDAALALLHALLAPERGDRPQHAIQISRLIAAVRGEKPVTPWPTRAPHCARPAPGRQFGGRA